VLDLKNGELNHWLKESEESLPHIDDVVSPADQLSSMMYDLVAEDAAIEDVLYYMNRALEHNKINLETFLKQHRQLARDQFYKRALCKKIFAMQQPTMMQL